MTAVAVAAAAAAAAAAAVRISPPPAHPQKLWKLAAPPSPLYICGGLAKGRGARQRCRAPERLQGCTCACDASLAVVRLHGNSARRGLFLLPAPPIYLYL
eukprot:365050-Chlamydomonas_euryale.AAC.8